MAFHRFIKAALRGDPITLYGDGEQTRDFTFVTDAVAATVAAGEQGVPGRAYNVGGGSRVSVNQRAANHRADSRVSRSTSGASRRRRETCATRSRTTSLARTDLGFAPRTTLEQGLEAEYEWLKNTPALLASAVM